MNEKETIQSKTYAVDIIKQMTDSAFKNPFTKYLEKYYQKISDNKRLRIYTNTSVNDAIKNFEHICQLLYFNYFSEI